MSAIALTPAQIEILAELCRDGAGNAAIAARTNRSARSINTYFVGIFEALHCDSRAGAVVAALRDPALRPVCFPWLEEASAWQSLRRELADELLAMIDEWGGRCGQEKP